MGNSIRSKSIVDCTICPVRHTGFCSRLSGRVQAKISEIARASDFLVNRRLWESDGTLHFIGIMRTGYLRLQRYGIDGQRKIVGMLPPGELIGEVVEARGGYELEAATKVSMCRFDRKAFHRMMEEEQELRRAVLDQYSERLEQTFHLAWLLGSLSMRERFRDFLAKATRTMPYQPLPDGKGILTLAIPRGDIASLLRTSVESISRMSHELEEDGLINILSPIHFCINDLNALTRHGETHLKSRLGRPGISKSSERGGPKFGPIRNVKTSTDSEGWLCPAPPTLAGVGIQRAQ